MEREVRGWTLGELSELLGAELSGPSSHIIHAPAPAGSGGATELTFARDDKFLKLAEASDVGAVLARVEATSSKPLLRVEHPEAAFHRFLALCARPLPIQQGIHPTASIDPRASVSANASVGAYVVIERDAVISDGCRIYPFCYVGENCRLDEDVVLFPHAVLYQDVRIGRGAVVHAGAVLGADGFGFVWDGDKHRKVPQVGSVVVGPDCEVGALTAVDRATVGQTSIGADVKLDNLVQIAHNASIGDHTVIASQSGVAGSSLVGSRVTIAGQVGLGDHVRIGDGVIITARSATVVDVPEPGIYKGFPLRPLTAENRLIAIQNRLPDLVKRIRELEKKVEELESNA